MNKLIAGLVLALVTGIALGAIGAMIPDVKAETPNNSAYIGGGCYKYRHAVYCE